MATFFDDKSVPCTDQMHAFFRHVAEVFCALRRAAARNKYRIAALSAEGADAPDVIYVLVSYEHCVHIFRIGPEVFERSRDLLRRKACIKDQGALPRHYYV